MKNQSTRSLSSHATNDHNTYDSGTIVALRPLDAVTRQMAYAAARVAEGTIKHEPSRRVEREWRTKFYLHRHPQKHHRSLRRHTQSWQHPRDTRVQCAQFYRSGSIPGQNRSRNRHRSRRRRRRSGYSHATVQRTTVSTARASTSTPRVEDIRKKGRNTHDVTFLTTLVARLGLGFHRAIARNVALHPTYTHTTEIGMSLWKKRTRKKGSCAHSYS